MKLSTPTVPTYTDLTADQFDTLTADATIYQGFENVTTAVRAAGAGSYTVANVQVDTGTSQYGGWALLVAYSDPATARHNLIVFDGLKQLSAAAPSMNVTATGLTAPSSGTVDADLGTVALDGDRARTGDGMRLQGTSVSEVLNPVDNVFNSTIGRRGTRIAAKSPDYVDQLGFDADTIAANGVLPAGATTASVDLARGNDTYTPGVLSLVADSEVDPPETTVTSGPAGATNDTTPTFALASDETGSTFECRVDTGAWGACTSPFTTAALPEGAHTLEARATDDDGALNVDPTPASRGFTVDTTMPDSSFTSGPTGLTNDSTPSFGLGSTDAGSTFECRVDGGAFSACASPLTTPALADGAHTVDVRATDPAGNVDPTPATRSFSVDTRLPVATVTGGPTGVTPDATPTFSFTSDEPGSTFECRFDGVTWSACSSPHTAPTLTDGGHAFAVRATDPAGNVGAQTAPRIFSVDTTPPETTIAAGPAGTTSDATPTFSLSADEAGSTFECRVDGGAWAPCTSPHTRAALADGDHVLEARATDGVGNVEPSPGVWAFSVDTAAPQTTISSGPTGLTNDATPTFTFTADEPGSTFECRIDGGGWAACASPDDVPTLGDGTHTYEVRALDAVGNADATPASQSITVDTDAPDTTIAAGPTGPTNDPTPTFALAADEAGSTFECRVDGGAWETCASPVTTSTLADGSHAFEARATDPAGNVDPTPASDTVVVDTAAPETTISAPPAGPTSDATPTFAFTADEPGSTFECSVDGGPWATCPSPLTTPALADGAHTVDVRAIDTAGNVDPSPASRTVVVDTAAPSTTISSGPSPTTNDATPTFAFTADEPGATFECSVDGGAWTACSSPRSLGALGDGDDTFDVRAIDPAGTTDPAPDGRTFTVDTRAPDTTITTGPSGQTNDATPAFAFTSDDAGATFECRVASGVWVPCASPETTASLADGDHTFEVRAIDAAGNADPTPDQSTITVDTLAPPTTIDAGPSGPTTDATPTFAFSSDEAGTTFGCRIDGDPFAACTSPETTAALADGDHVFEVRATDPAGNTDASPAAGSFTIDTASPGTAIIAAPASPTRGCDPDLRLHGRRARLHVRVPRRRRAVGRLRAAG